ncbi:hypothetical protein L9F63_022033, partial [Diploptera punctata]
AWLRDDACLLVTHMASTSLHRPVSTSNMLKLLSSTFCVTITCRYQLGILS